MLRYFLPTRRHYIENIETTRLCIIPTITTNFHSGFTSPVLNFKSFKNNSLNFVHIIVLFSNVHGLTCSTLLVAETFHIRLQTQLNLGTLNDVGSVKHAAGGNKSIISQVNNMLVPGNILTMRSMQRWNNEWGIVAVI